MEDLFEIIAAIIAIAMGVAFKSTKKKAGNVKKHGSAAHNTQDSFDWELTEFPMENEELEIFRPDAPADPTSVAIQLDKIAAPDAVLNPMNDGGDAETHPEGCHSEEGSTPGIHMESIRTDGAANVRNMETQPTSAVYSDRPQTAETAPVKADAARLRQAVIMSEVLGKPVALRGGMRR